jgi:hypothetical protein
VSESCADKGGYDGKEDDHPTAGDVQPALQRKRKPIVSPWAIEVDVVHLARLRADSKQTVMAPNRVPYVGVGA